MRAIKHLNWKTSKPALAGRASDGRRHRRIRRWALTALCMSLAGGAGACGPASATPANPTAAGSPAAAATPRPTSIPVPAPTPTTADQGTWRMLPAAPLPAPQTIPAAPALAYWRHLDTVWNGTELFLLGIQAARSIDLAYSPAANRWRRLPASPYPTHFIEGGRWAVWNGAEILMFGQMSAAYNPATNRWRPLRPATLGGPSIVVWTGRQVVIWGGGCCSDYSSAGAAYDPLTDIWRSIPASPLAGRHTTGVWTGREMIVVGGVAEALRAGRDPQTKFFADAAAYNPTTRSWRKLPSLPAPRMKASVTWAGTEVLVVGVQRPSGAILADGYAYSPTSNRWRHLPAMDVGRTGHVATWTGSHLLIWGGATPTKAHGQYTTPPNGLAYDPATNHWSALPKSPLRGRTPGASAWTGSEMIVWGGLGVTNPDREFTDGAAYRPYTVSTSP